MWCDWKLVPWGFEFYFQANYSDWWLGYLLWNSSEIDVSDSVIKIHEVVMWYYYLKLLILRHQGSLDWENIIMGFVFSCFRWIERPWMFYQWPSSSALPALCAGHRWIRLTKASDAELWCFFICASTNGWVSNQDAIVMFFHWICAKYIDIFFGVSLWTNIRVAGYNAHVTSLSYTMAKYHYNTVQYETNLHTIQILWEFEELEIDSPFVKWHQLPSISNASHTHS